MIDVALKEWAVVCDLLGEGRLAMLIRKGGIHETGGPGVFEMEHDRFALFPSWAHQRPAMVRESVRPRVRVLEEPETVSLASIADAVKIWCVEDRARFAGLEDLHCWSPAHIDMRFEYKPERPVYVVAVRVHKLAAPQAVENDAAYGGCRSWVALKPGDAIDDRGAQPVLPDERFEALIGRLDSALG